MHISVRIGSKNKLGGYTIFIYFFVRNAGSKAIQEVQTRQIFPMIGKKDKYGLFQEAKDDNLQKSEDMFPDQLSFHLLYSKIVH